MFDNSMFDDLNDFDWRENKSYVCIKNGLYQCLFVLLNLACDANMIPKSFLGSQAFVH